MIMTCKGSTSGLMMKATPNLLGGHRRGQGEDRRDDPDRGGAAAIGQNADADDRDIVDLNGRQVLITHQ